MAYRADFAVYQVIVVRDLDVRIDRVEPGGVEHEFGVTDEVDHVGQLGLRGLE